MLLSFLTFIVELIPVITVPQAFTDGILEAVEYVYWANYYLPVDTFASCLAVYFGYQFSLYMIKFLVNTVNSFIPSFI